MMGMGMGKMEDREETTEQKTAAAVREWKISIAIISAQLILAWTTKCSHLIPFFPPSHEYYSRYGLAHNNAKGIECIDRKLYKDGSRCARLRGCECFQQHWHYVSDSARSGEINELRVFISLE